MMSSVRFPLSLAIVAACAPLAFAAEAPSPARDASSGGDAIQRMDGFTMAGYAADGRKRWDLEGTGATVDGPIVTIDRPNGVGYDVPDPSKPGLTVSGGQVKKPDADGTPKPARTAYVTASIAQIEQNSRKIRLEHDVTIHTSDGMWLFSPMMYWLPDTSEMVTDQPVRLETGQMVIRGREAVAQTELKQATIQRDVELIMDPKSDDAPAPGQSILRSGGRGLVTITCDGRLDFDYRRNIAVFHDHVHVNDRQGDLYSDRLVVYLNEATHDVRYAEALDHVRMVQNGRTAYSERAVYEPSTGLITLLGAPSLLFEDEEHGGRPAAPAPASDLASPLQEPPARR